MLNSFVCRHYHQNNFYLKNRLHQIFFSFFSSFSTSKCLPLFEVTLSLIPFNLTSKSVFVTKPLMLGILPLISLTYVS